MPTGALVIIPELQVEGLARMLGRKPGLCEIRFFASGAVMTQDERQVMRYCLLPGTRVAAVVAGVNQPGEITAARIGRDPASNLLVYGFRPTGGAEVSVREDGIVAIASPRDPVEQLAQVLFNDTRPAPGRSASGHEPWGPQTFCAREELLAWRDSAWSATGGVVGLAGARVRPLPHQLIAARRALCDRQIRFLFADEVGLGKTIEAGLVVQSLLAMKPDLRVLAIVPGALLSQWFLELYVKFGGRTFLMLDQERLRAMSQPPAAIMPGAKPVKAVNPWADEQFVLASSRAVEELEGKDALRLAQSKWDVLIVDECHRMQPGGVLYKRVAALSKATPHVLLLSATPARQHADAYLALLALLQPQLHREQDQAAFASKLAAHDRVVDLLGRSLAADAAAEAKALAAAWKELLGADALIAKLADDWKRAPAVEAGAARDRMAAYVREHYQLDRRVVRNRRQVLSRLAAASGVAEFSRTSRSRELVRYAPSKAEAAVRAAMTAYRSRLLTIHAESGEVPPRLAHWLLQIELAASHPAVLERLLAMRATVLRAPEDYDEYRARAKPDETLARVLRSDLSENEVAGHIATSAACWIDSGEDKVLATLRAAVGAWQKAADGAARVKALIARIEAFWADQPQEKILVFTAHGLAVGPLAEALADALPAISVQTFGAHQDTLAREESSRKFEREDASALMVCDPLGGEGRNFQFVSAIAHFDLPWSLAAVEQRIGRVDRIGRDGDVPSWVFVAADPDAVDAAWAEVLDESVGVFAASSSGLEFAADALEARALDAGLHGGGSAVRATIPDLTALVGRERDARDAREDECFHADAAAYAAASHLADDVSRVAAPSSAVARWVRGMGGSARREEEHPQPWRLKTRLHDQGVQGVFDRQSALARPDLAYFALGQNLVDRLVADAAAADWCRATAWRRPPAPPLEKWDGVRCVFELVLDLQPLVAAGVRVDVLRRLLALAPPARLTLFARADDAVVETAADRLAVLSPPFDAKAGDATLSAVNRETWTKPLLGGQGAKVGEWQVAVRRAAAAAALAADARLPEVQAKASAGLAALEPGLAALQAVAAATVVRLGEAHPDARQAVAEAAEEERQITALRAAVAGARLEMASAAYIAVT